MSDTFLDRARAHATRYAFMGALVGLQTIACSQSNTAPSDDTMPIGEAGSSGTAGSPEGAGGDMNSTTGGGQSTGGSSGVGGATGKAGAGGGGGGGGADVIVDAGPRVGKLKIMALGDSTTCCTCFRAELAKLLDKSHPNDYQFVGTINNDFGGCGGYAYDKHNQGMGGYLVTQTAANAMDAGTQHTAEVPTWTALAPDVVLLHFATNDVWNQVASAKILAAYTWMVAQFRKTNPRVTILAAQLIPLDPLDADGGHSCATCPAGMQALNAAIPAWAAATNTAASRVIVVDQWTGYVANVDSCAPGRCDGVHPGPTGSVKMAAKWDEKLEPLF